MRLRLELDYDLAEGAITPFVEGLRRGVAVACACVACGRTTFPPDRRCGCSAGADNAPGLRWRELSGSARVIHRTDGPGGHFALVRFDGADNCAVCRIVNPQYEGGTAALQPSNDEKPAICVEIGR